MGGEELVTVAVAAVATHQAAEGILHVVRADVVVMGVALVVVVIAGAVRAEAEAVVAAAAVVEEPALAVPSARARAMGVLPVVVITISVTAHVTQPRSKRIEAQSHERSCERYRGSE